MPVRKTRGNTSHHLHQDSSCGPGWPGKSGYNLRPRLCGSTGPANCSLSKEWPVVGTAWPEHPFTSIESDSIWSTQTHLGYEYAALLVNADYHPAPTIDVAPTVGGSVEALKIDNGVGSLPDLPVIAASISKKEGSSDCLPSSPLLPRAPLWSGRA